jgi:hypothetical protein
MMNYQNLYKEFLKSDDTLRLYREEKMIYSSKKDRLMPLMDYIKERGPDFLPAVIFDKVIGNAAALLAVKVSAQEVYAPLGSELGVKTLKQHHIKFHLDTTVPCIMRDDGTDMCPMEKLSKDKTTEEFYTEMKKRVEAKK